MVHVTEMAEWTEGLDKAYREAMVGQDHKFVDHGDGTWHYEDEKGNWFGYGASTNAR